MQEPSVRTSRLAIAGFLVAAAVIGGAGFLIGRVTIRSPQPVVVTAPAPEPLPVMTPAAADVPQTLGRADLIALAGAASDAYATGRAAPESVARAVGKRFELTLPFGCAGPSNVGDNALSGWRFDPDERTLRVSVAPTAWRSADWGLGDDDGLSGEGFWITRPWSSDIACPTRHAEAAPLGAEAVTLPGQTLAVAQFFTGGADRDTRREGRPFSVVKRIAGGSFDGSKGLSLNVTGRIDRVPGGGPVRCVQPAGIDQRPICVIAIRIDEVRIANPATGEMLGSWPVVRPVPQ